MKRILAILLAMMMVFSLAACTSSNEPSEEPAAEPETTEEEAKLVVYTAASDEQLDVIIPLYEEKYGVEVEVISAGTGEMLARADSEKADPYGDLFLGGGESNFNAYSHLFQPYVSSEDANLIPEFRNNTGWISYYYLDCPTLLYNNDLIGDIEIKGYEDLLQPELKGKIAMPDPTASSSAIMHVQTILTDFGGLDVNNEQGWDFMTKLYENMDGKMASGSSAAYKSVVDGENTVALTYEEASVRLVSQGANVTIVYMEEGTFFTPTTLGIFKDCKHLENAKKFVDLCLSQEVQNILCKDLCLRPVRDDVDYPDYFASVSDVYTVELDQDYINEHNPELIERCKDIQTTIGF